MVIISLTEADIPVLQKAVCQRFAMPKQMVNAIVKAMIDKGWAALKVSEQDRRSRELCLTPEGRTVAARIVQELQTHEMQVWEKLGREQAEQLIEYTPLYNRYFKEVND